MSAIILAILELIKCIALLIFFIILILTVSTFLFYFFIIDNLSKAQQERINESITKFYEKILSRENKKKDDDKYKW